MRNAGFKKKSPQKGYILADRVLQDVCESVSDSDGENYDTGNNYNPRNKNSNKGRRNRRAKRTDGEKFTNMNQFDYRNSADQYSDDSEVEDSFSNSTSMYERDYQSPNEVKLDKIRPQTPQQPFINPHTNRIPNASNPNNIGGNKHYINQTRAYYDPNTISGGSKLTRKPSEDKPKVRKGSKHRRRAKNKPHAFQKSSLPADYRLDSEASDDSDYEGRKHANRRENKNRNRKNHITQNYSQFPKSSTSRPIATDRLAHKFHQTKCEKYPSKHGSYDFICIDPNTPYETLVCIDCFKDNPSKMRYFQENTDQFVRFNHFFDQCQNPHISDRSYQKLESLTRFENRFESLLSSWSSEEAREVKKFKSFFRNLENAFIDKVQYYLRKTFVKMIDQVKDTWGKSRSKIEDVYNTTQNLTNFLNDGHLKDLEAFIKESKDSKRGLNKLKRKIQQLVGLNYDLDYLVKDFSKQIMPLGNRKLEKELMPVQDLTPLCKVYQKKLKLLESDLKDVMNKNRNADQTMSGLHDLLGDESVEEMVKLRKRRDHSPGNSYQSSKQSKKGRKGSRRRRNRRKNRPETILEADNESYSKSSQESSRADDYSPADLRKLRNKTEKTRPVNQVEFSSEKVKPEDNLNFKELRSQSKNSSQPSGEEFTMKGRRGVQQPLIQHSFRNTDLIKEQLSQFHRRPKNKEGNLPDLNTAQNSQFFNPKNFSHFPATINEPSLKHIAAGNRQFHPVSSSNDSQTDLSKQFDQMMDLTMSKIKSRPGADSFTQAKSGFTSPGQSSFGFNQAGGQKRDREDDMIGLKGKTKLGEIDAAINQIFGEDDLGNGKKALQAQQRDYRGIRSDNLRPMSRGSSSDYSPPQQRGVGLRSNTKETIPFNPPGSRIKMEYGNEFGAGR